MDLHSHARISLPYLPFFFLTFLFPSFSSPYLTFPTFLLPFQPSPKLSFLLPLLSSWVFEFEGKNYIYYIPLDKHKSILMSPKIHIFLKRLKFLQVLFTLKKFLEIYIFCLFRKMLWK